jgi:hypothetical protein
MALSTKNFIETVRILVVNVYKYYDVPINVRSLLDQSINSIKTEDEYIRIGRKEVDDNNYIAA